MFVREDAVFLRLSSLNWSRWILVVLISTLGLMLTTSSLAQTVSSVTFESKSVVGGGKVRGTVLVSSPAPSLGLTVTLATTDPNITTVGTLFIAANTRSANFEVQTTPVGANDSVSVKAVLGNSSAKGSFVILAPIPTSLVIAPITVTGGFPTNGTVHLSGPAASNGLTVALASPNPTVTVPPTVNFPAGSRSASFPISTSPVSSTVIVQISASVKGTIQRAPVIVYPPAPASVVLNPQPVFGGQTVSGTVTLNGDAPAAGLLVNVKIDQPIASVVSIQSISAGGRVGTFTLKTKAVPTRRNAKVTITAGHASYDALLTVTPVGSLSASAWPSLRGDSVNSGTGLGSGAIGSVKWSRELGGLFVAAPVVGSDGTLYCATESGIYALDRTGKRVWTYNTAGGLGTLALGSDGTIYGTTYRNLIALKPDGSLKWNYTSKEGFYSSPSVSPDGTVYAITTKGNLVSVSNQGIAQWSVHASSYFAPGVGADGTLYLAEDPGIVALNKDGSTKWTFPLLYGAYGHAVVGKDGNILVIDFLDVLNSVTPQGQVAWRAEFGNGDFTYTNGVDPVVGQDGTIYVADAHGVLNALGTDGKTKWTVPTLGYLGGAPGLGADGTAYQYADDGSLYSIAPDGNINWIQPANVAYTSSPVVGMDGSIYVVSPSGQLTNLNTLGVQKWTVSPLGIQTNSTAIAADGTTFVGTSSGRFLAILPSGQLKWSFQADGAIYSTPALAADGSIIFGTTGGSVFSLSAAGSKQWVFSSPGVYGFAEPIVASPAIGRDGTIVIGSTDGGVYALTPEGKEKWSYFTDSYVESSALIANDGTVFIGSDDGNLYAINPNGFGRWAFPTGDSIYGAPVLGPNGTIYFGSYDNNVYAIDQSGNEIWEFKTGAGIYASLALAPDNTIYAASEDGNVYALQSDGTRKWAYSTGSYIDSSPTLALDGTVYFGGSDGQVYALTPTGAKLWTTNVGSPVISSVTIGLDGTLYFATQSSKIIRAK